MEAARVAAARVEAAWVAAQQQGACAAMDATRKPTLSVAMAQGWCPP